MKYILLLIVTVLSVVSVDAAPKREYYEIRIYYFKEKSQEERIDKYLKDYAKGHQAKGNGFGYSLFGPDDVARTLSARYYKDGSEILIDQPGNRPRRLTPLECARLMGFDRGDRRWHIPVSDTQAYRQFGNAVVPKVAKAIARQIAEVLQWHNASE